MVWITADSPSWIWGSETFQQLFSVPSGVEASPDLVVQSLPVFNPVVRGTTWSLFRRGEMVPRHRLSPENEQQGMLLRRIETLERRLSQQMIRQDTEINELKTQLHIQQNVLDRLLRITETRQPDSSG
ncbi:hypothetical protein KQ304_06990 [Synechococcus sp. CS-1329]|uniref:hypothetical protein n=1 Tax=Synechococcus sp. CS-1329 TaxID=2847975 RepID=UPI00223C48A5|nr:hypothetical protein [Synechococcus sp. CS-1329]MCT0218743.1 hypothetical protein [Synechococcus sp. CS-1329]